MAEENKLAFKDARTARELLAQLRSEADLLATDLVLQQMLYCLVFVSNIALIALAALKFVSLGTLAMAVAGSFVPLMTLTAIGTHFFFWLDKKTYAVTVRSVSQMPLEVFLEMMVIEQLSRLDKMLSYRKSIRVVTGILAFYLGFLGVVFFFAGSAVPVQ